MGSILELLGVKIWRFWGPGVSGGASGSHVGTHGRPEGRKYRKRPEKAHPWEPISEAILSIFSDFGVFFCSQISSRFLDGF